MKGYTFYMDSFFSHVINNFLSYGNILIREGFKKKRYGNFHTFADPPKVWKIIFYFFSIVDHYWRFF